jgi:Holliday junction resolvase RusA-like endonuclease
MNYCINCGRRRDGSSILKGYLVAQLMPYESFLCCECNLIQSEKTKAIFDCVLSDKVVPKSRPRVTKNATFFPPTYTRWREVASRAITEAIRLNLRAAGKVPADLLPFDKDHPIAIFVDFYGSLRGNSDLDNAIGSILDVLAFKGWCLQDDNVQRVPLIYARFHVLPKSTKKNPQAIRTELKIYSLLLQIVPELPKSKQVKTKKTAINKTVATS